MRDMQIRITGVYDQRTLKSLDNLKINHVGFDMHPLSFSFLQGYKLLELLEKSYRFESSYYLQFKNEKAEIISYILSEIEKRFGIKGSGRFPVNIFLEFHGNEEPSLMESFNWKYLFYYNGEAALPSLKESELLYGMIIDYQMLKTVLDKGTLFEFIKELNRWMLTLINRQDFKIFIHLNWDQTLDEQIATLLPSSIISLPINRLVEIGYREVDLPKLEKSIEYYKNLE